MDLLQKQRWIIIISILVNGLSSNNELPVRGIIHEKVKLKLGTNLKYLWSNNRIVMSSEVYKTYEYDVPKLYAADEYEIDPITRLKKMTIVDGQVTFNKLHSKGDPYLDSNNDPIMEHKPVIQYLT